MDLRSLRYFLQIAELGNLTRAATRLRVAQPSLTRHMHQLEQELGTSLFLRANKGVTLTDAGLLLRENAERILRDIDHVRSEIRSREKQPRGTVALGGGKRPRRRVALLGRRAARPAERQRTGPQPLSHVVPWVIARVNPSERSLRTPGEGRGRTR